MFLETNHETLFPAAPHGRKNSLITPGEVILYIVYLNEPSSLDIPVLGAVLVNVAPLFKTDLYAFPFSSHSTINFWFK